MRLIIGLLLVWSHAEKAVEEVLHTALPTLATLSATLVLIVVVIAIRIVRGLLLRRSLLEGFASATARLLLFFWQRLSIDVHNCRTDFLGYPREVGGKIFR